MKPGKTFLKFLTLFFILIIAFNAVAETKQYKSKRGKKIKIAVMDFNSLYENSVIANEAYQKIFKKRGWKCDVFDLKGNLVEASTIMQNIIAAGYDGICINWVPIEYYKQELILAEKKQIPVLTFGTEFNAPGMVKVNKPFHMGQGLVTANFLATEILKSGGKVVVLTLNAHNAALERYLALKTLFDYNNIEIYKELEVDITKDFYIWAEETVTNLLLADKNKEIKGIWTFHETTGAPAAKAAHKAGRDDVIIVTCDDSPGVYKAMRDYPNLLATTSTMSYHVQNVERIICEEGFDIIFAGKEFETSVVEYQPLIIITQDNLPPEGYYFRSDGKYTGKPDF